MLVGDEYCCIMPEEVVAGSFKEVEEERGIDMIYVCDHSDVVIGS